MKKTEINAIVNAYTIAVADEEAAKNKQRMYFRQLQDELFKFKNLLIETGDINFGTPIKPADERDRDIMVIGIFFDNSYSNFFPEGRVRLKVTEYGVFNRSNGVHETVPLLAKVLEFATIEANKRFK